MTLERLHPERLLEAAREKAGCNDFGEATWREGLERLIEALSREADLSELGVEVAGNDLESYLTNRASIVRWHKEHPEVSEEAISAPIVIVGQPRTGTTILHDLLAQDPSLRAPLTWEVDRPVPPPLTATFQTDPRIQEVQAAIEITDSLIPGFTSFHPMGAKLAQECVRITGGEFRSMIFSTQYRVPGYENWLLREADLGPAYRWHRRYLQHLQSGHPARRWLLKSPAHLWHLHQLAAEYPDATVIQAHRDPLKVIASTSALIAHLRRLASDRPDLREIAANQADVILLGLERGMNARDAGIFPSSQFHDIHFTDFVADPLTAIGRLYDSMGMDLTSECESRMAHFLASNPGDGGGGGKRYRFADTGLDADLLRERSQEYQRCYGVENEPVI